MINKVGLKSLLKMFNNNQFLFARVKFPLPDLGQKIKQGSVKKLYVKEGDKVQQFQKIADVESDKQFTQITAPQVGVIAKIYYKQAEVCKVGDLFLQIDTDGTGQQPQKNSQKSVQKKQQKSSATAQVQSHNQNNSSESEVLASPVVKMFAKSSNVELSSIKGSGKRGRVLKQDIINFIQNKVQQKQKPEKTQSKIQSQSTQKVKSFENKKVSMNPFQKGMQKSMTEANKVPHLYYNEVMDITELDSMREKLKSSGLKVTVMGIITKTFSLALTDNPKMNSSYRTDKNQFEYTIHDNHNISLAIDTVNGLVVPNIKNVQNLSIVQIQQKLSQLKKLADSAKLTRQHLQGGTICLSNIGTIAGVSACPLVLVPQTCIVAIGKVVQTPYFVGENILKKKYITMSFGCDHRVIDGGSVARFSNSWKGILENPYLALAKMR